MSRQWPVWVRAGGSSDTNPWELSQTTRSEQDTALQRGDHRPGAQVEHLTHRPVLRVLRNQGADREAVNVLTSSPLRAERQGIVAQPDGPRTVEAMSATNSAGASGLRVLTARPARDIRSTAKTISQMDPAVVVPAAADPAVLVDLHSDLRLSLATLANHVGVTLAEHQAVTSLATGCIELAPLDDTDEALFALRVDARQRLRLTSGDCRAWG